MENEEIKRSWHTNFKEYTEFITGHENYKGLFFERGTDGKIKWVVAGKSEKGIKRRLWWDAQCVKHNLKIEAGVYAKIALILHPTKFHVCQICGKKLSVEYVYPNKRTIKQLEIHFQLNITPFSNTVYEIIDSLDENISTVEILKKIFKIHDKVLTKSEVKAIIYKDYTSNYTKSFLSPGAMSNSPDRFDGFHSDGACCRHESDKGRHKENLQRYGQDRRVYENWADGDWKMADRLMSLFRIHGLSADHIGPISLGFCHRPKFHPLTKEENSAKNNRMTLSDVRVLIEDEKKEVVVSWHSKYIWDRLKNKVHNDKDAIRLSDLMRKNLHHVLIIFSIIDDSGYRQFLEQFLNPQFSFFDYRFKGFNPITGTYTEVEQIKREGKNQENNTERYYRVSFDSLKEYKDKDNRKSKIWSDTIVDEKISHLKHFLSMNQKSEALVKLNDILNHLSLIAEFNWPED
jgi:Alw26I/Eco31I/Esp3I family type II restriction endonuclease